MWRRSIPVVATLAVALALAASACSSPPPASAPPPASPSASPSASPAGPSPGVPSSAAPPAAPPVLPPRDGDVVASEPVTVPFPARALRLLYRSTDTAGRPVAVSGTVLLPLTPPPGPVRLLSYAVGTHGLADRCAPSRQLPAGTDYEAGAIAALVAGGYAVAVTDYEGLGTPGEHTYAERAAQGHAVLDAARAARRLGVGVPADGPVALVGYSQGGGAVAAAAELAPTYAPDVGLVGAYAGAVPADLAAVGAFLDGSPSAGLLGYALSGFDAAYPDLDVPAALNDRGRAFLADVRTQCVADTTARYPNLATATLTRDGRPLAALLAAEPYRSRVEEQRLGTVAPRVPVLVGHSSADDVVPFAQDAEMVRRWCAQGADVTFVPVAVPGHAAAATALAPTAFAFLDARFRGVPTAGTCRA